MLTLLCLTLVLGSLYPTYGNPSGSPGHILPIENGAIVLEEESITLDVSFTDERPGVTERCLLKCEARCEYRFLNIGDSSQTASIGVAAERERIMSKPKGWWEVTSWRSVVEDLEIKVAGNLGYKAGRYRTRGEDGSLIDRGKYIEIWSKIDGNWVLHRDIWNSSVQPGIDDEE